MKNTMKTMNDVLREANERVASLMSEGYMISFGDSSFGYKFRVDLENGEKRVRVKVQHTTLFPTSVVELAVIEIPGADDFERGDAAVFYSKTWYVIDEKRHGEYILTESKEEMDAVEMKRRERNERMYGMTAHRRGQYTPSGCLKPTAALIRKLKSRKGFTNATRDRIRVIRVKDGYEVSLKAREGHIRRQEIIRFPQR